MWSMRLILVAILLFPSFAHGKGLVIIGWDGAGLRNVKPMTEQGTLPNLKGILDSGGSLLHLEPLTWTVTVPNWSVLFTGKTPDFTGAFGNEPDIQSPVTRRVELRKWWIFQLRAVDLILYHLKTRGIRVGWFVSKICLGDDPEKSPFAAFAGNKPAAYKYSSPPDQGDQYLWDLTYAAGDFIETCERRNRDYVVFLHLNPDYYGHREGEGSERYRAEFGRCDEALGYILTKATQGKVINVSDHGFNPGTRTHNDAPDNFMGTNLPIGQNWVDFGGATMRDVTKTIWDYFFPEEEFPYSQAYGKSLLTQ